MKKRRAGSLTRFVRSGIVGIVNVRWMGLLLLWLVNVAQANPPCDDGDVACLEARIADNPADVESRLALGQLYLERGLFGGGDAFDAALVQFEAILQIEPQYPLARANRGLIWVHRAADATTPVGQLERARRGFEEIDAGVALAPEDSAVRLVRAINAYQMPRWVERRAVAEQDFAWLLARLDAGPTAHAALARKILFHAGSFALKERRPEAISLLVRALAAPGERPSAAEVQSMLALAREQFTPHNDAEKEKR